MDACLCIVENLPLNATKHELEEFVKIVTGGADFSTILPLESDCISALIKFNKSKDAEKFRSQDFVYQGNDLKISTAPYQVFQKVNCSLDPSLLSLYPDLQQLSRQLKERYGVEVCIRGNTDVQLIGPWLNICAVNAHLQRVVTRRGIPQTLNLPNGSSASSELTAESTRPSSRGSERSRCSSQADRSQDTDELLAAVAPEVCESPVTMRSRRGRRNSDYDNMPETNATDSIDGSPTPMKNKRTHSLYSTYDNMGLARAEQDSSSDNLSTDDMDLDSNACRYIGDQCKDTLAELSEAHAVNIRFEPHGDLCRVHIDPVNAQSTDSIEAARSKFVGLYQAIFTDLVHEQIHKVLLDVDAAALRRAIQFTRVTQPQVCLFSDENGNVNLVGPSGLVPSASKLFLEELTMVDSKLHPSGSDGYPLQPNKPNSESVSNGSINSGLSSLQDVPVTGATVLLGVDVLLRPSEKSPTCGDSSQVSDASPQPIEVTESPVIPAQTKQHSSQLHTADSNSSVSEILESNGGNHVGTVVPLFRNVQLEFVCESLVSCPAEAVVIPCSEQLTQLQSDGPAVDVLTRAGPELQALCSQMLRRSGPLRAGEAVVTRSTGTLKCKHIVHAVGPRWRDYKYLPENADGRGQCEVLLRRTYIRSLRQADEVAAASSVAIPPLSSGSTDVPLDLCGTALLSALAELDSSRPRSVRRVMVVNSDPEANDLFIALALSRLETNQHSPLQHVVKKPDRPLSNKAHRSATSTYHDHIHSSDRRAYQTLPLPARATTSGARVSNESRRRRFSVDDESLTETPRMSALSPPTRGPSIRAPSTLGPTSSQTTPIASRTAPSDTGTSSALRRHKMGSSHIAPTPQLCANCGKEVRMLKRLACGHELCVTCNVRQSSSSRPCLLCNTEGPPNKLGAASGGLKPNAEPVGLIPGVNSQPSIVHSGPRVVQHNGRDILKPAAQLASSSDTRRRRASADSDDDRDSCDSEVSFIYHAAPRKNKETNPLPPEAHAQFKPLLQNSPQTRQPKLSGQLPVGRRRYQQSHTAPVGHGVHGLNSSAMSSGSASTTRHRGLASTSPGSNHGTAAAAAQAANSVWERQFHHARDESAFAPAPRGISMPPLSDGSPLPNSRI